MYAPCAGFGSSAEVTDTRGLNAVQAAPGAWYSECGHAANGPCERVARCVGARSAVVPGAITIATALAVFTTFGNGTGLAVAIGDAECRPKVSDDRNVFVS